MSGPRRLRTSGWLASAARRPRCWSRPARPRRPARSRRPRAARSRPSCRTLSGSGRKGFRFLQYRDFRVKITCAGVVLYDQPAESLCDQFCTPDRVGAHRDALGLRDLNADGEPETIVDLFTGGASCCVLVLAYGYDAPANTYRRAELDTGGGFVARDLGQRRRDRAGGRRLPLPRPLYLRRMRPATDPDLALGTPPLRGGDTPTSRRRSASTPAGCASFYARVRHRNEAAFVKGALTPVAADLRLLDQCGRGFRVVRVPHPPRRAQPRAACSTSRRSAPNDLRALKRFLRRTGYL